MKALGFSKALIIKAPSGQKFSRVSCPQCGGVLPGLCN
jgi:hypothetical protein